MNTVSRKEFLGGLFAGVGLAGCRSVALFGAEPRISFGVVSDIHVTTPESTAMFRRALRYFRSRGVDAVIVSGDLADWGLKSSLGYVAKAWCEEMAGTPIVPLFCTGNHDFDGWWYGDMTLDMHVQGYSEDEALLKLGMKDSWEEVFGTPYDVMRCRKVKGFNFVSCECASDWDKPNDAIAAKWLEDHANELKDDQPFFFFRHYPIPGTDPLRGKHPGTQENAVIYNALAKFSNAVVFTGHTHWTLNDERSIWQNEFTAIDVPSLSYTSMPSGYENGSAARRTTTTLGMSRLPSRDDLAEAQGYVVSVYDEQMVVERYDFAEQDEAASPWIVPLPITRAKPYTLEENARRVSIPQFPSDATLKTYTTNADRRNGTWAIFMTLEFPSAQAENGRVFDYEASAVSDSGEVLATKRFLSPGFYKAESKEPEVQKFRFDAMDLPEKGRYRLRVTPRNCFGGAGEPIYSRTFEPKPGKDKFVK